MFGTLTLPLQSARAKNKLERLERTAAIDYRPSQRKRETVEKQALVARTTRALLRISENNSNQIRFKPQPCHHTISYPFQ